MFYLVLPIEPHERHPFANVETSWLPLQEFRSPYMRTSLKACVIVFFTQRPLLNLFESLKKQKKELP